MPHAVSPSPTLTRASDERRASTRLKHLAWNAVRTLTTPLLPDDYLDLVDPLRSPRYLRARVVDVHPETQDAATVTLQPGLGWAGHVPGQFIRIGVDVDGVRLWRAYSVTSGPRDDGRITITVKSLSGGLVSSHLHESLRAGQIVHLEQASGEFVWTGGVEPTLYVTGGSGMLRMLREFAELNGVEDKLHTENFVVELAEPGEGGTATIVMGTTTREVAVSGETSILDAAEAADVLVPSGCRMGICYGCVLPLRSGAVRDMRTGEVTSGADGDGVMVQTCISSAAGDCTIGR